VRVFSVRIDQLQSRDLQSADQTAAGREWPGDWTVSAALIGLRWIKVAGGRQAATGRWRRGARSTGHRLSRHLARVMMTDVLAYPIDLDAAAAAAAATRWLSLVANKQSPFSVAIAELHAS